MEMDIIIFIKTFVFAATVYCHFPIAVCQLSGAQPVCQLYTLPGRERAVQQCCDLYLAGQTGLYVVRHQGWPQPV